MTFPWAPPSLSQAHPVVSTAHALLSRSGPRTAGAYTFDEAQRSAPPCPVEGQAGLVAR